MIRFFVLCVWTGSLLAGTGGQSETVIARKTEMFVSLERSVSTQTAKRGDRFHARLSVPVTQDDRIVIPAGAYLIGQVDAVKKPGRLRGKGEIMLSFDTVIFPSGVTRRMEARTESAEGYVTGAGDKEGRITTTSEQADEVLKYSTLGGATGAGTGGIADRSLRGAGIGGGIGAAAGAVVGLLLRGKHVSMARGTSLTVQLKDDTVLRQLQTLPKKTLKP